MRKWIPRLAAGALLLVGLVFALVAIGLPRLINTDEFRSALRERASSALGVPVSWSSLETGLFPPRLVIEDPVLSKPPSAEDAAGLTAESIDLRLSPWALLSRRIAVDSVVLHGAELTLTRTPTGFVLPLAQPAVEAEPATGSPGAASPAREAPVSESNSGFELSLGRVVLEGSRVVLHDRTLSPAQDWTFADLELEATGESLQAPLEVEWSSGIASGAGEALPSVGAMEGRGQVSLSGTYALTVDVEDVQSEAFRAYLFAEGENSISGPANGVVTLRGGADEASSIGADLKVEPMTLSAFSLSGKGSLAVNANLPTGGPLDFETTLDLESGGQLEAKGRRAAVGGLDVEAQLFNFDLAPLAARLGSEATLAGRATGPVEMTTTPEGAVSRLSTSLAVVQGRYQSGAVSLAGAIDLKVDAKTLGASDPIPFEVKATLDPGGVVQLKGTSTTEGRLDAKARFENFDLALAQPMLPGPGMQLAGRATGSGVIVGPASAPNRVELDWQVAGGRFETEEYSVVGPFQLDAKVASPLSKPSGQIDLDLTAAEVTYQEQFKKRPGQRAELSTTFSQGTSGALEFESQLKLRDLDSILLEGGFGDRTSLRATSASLSLASLSDLLPGLATYGAKGAVTLQGFGITMQGDAPARFSGRVKLQGVEASLPDAGRVRLTGDLVGEGPALRTNGLTASVGGTVLGIDGTLSDPLGKRAFDASVETVTQSEVNLLLSEFTEVRDVLFGAFEFGGRVQGVAGGEAAWQDTLVGDLQFKVGEDGGGRLRGVSILQRILDQIPIVGGAARLTRPFRGGKSVEDYFTETFEILEGDFKIGSGKVQADVLRIQYVGYEASLVGPMSLSDLSLDMKGQVVLREDLLSVLGGLVGADTRSREPVRIELARVTNTLSDPKVKMTSATLALLPRLLFQASGLEAVTIGIGQGINGGIQKGIEKGADALGRVLRGGAAKETAPATENGPSREAEDAAASPLPESPGTAAADEVIAPPRPPALPDESEALEPSGPTPGEQAPEAVGATPSEQGPEAVGATPSEQGPEAVDGTPSEQGPEAVDGSAPVSKRQQSRPLPVSHRGHMGAAVGRIT